MRFLVGTGVMKRILCYAAVALAAVTIFTDSSRAGFSAMDAET